MEKFLKRWQYQTTSPGSWETCIQVKKQQLELDMEQLTRSKLGKEHNIILSCYLTYMQSKYIMWNTRIDESQAGIKIPRRNINNFGYSDDTTLMAESEELKSFLMRVKEKSEKAGLKLNNQNTKITVSGRITPWQTEGEKGGSVRGSTLTNTAHPDQAP